MIDSNLVNQTQFSFEEPIFENAQVYIDEDQNEQKEKPKNTKKKLFIALSIFFTLIFLILLILLILKDKNKNVEVDEVVPEEQINAEFDPILERVDDARELLELADPTKHDLSFPPVDLKIRLDKKEK